jgi:hypothetical protein
LVAQVSVHHGDSVDHAALKELRLRHPIADQADNIGFRLQQSTDKPTSDQPCGARDEDTSVSPEVMVELIARGVGHFNVFDV